MELLLFLFLIVIGIIIYGFRKNYGKDKSSVSSKNAISLNSKREDGIHTYTFTKSVLPHGKQKGRFFIDSWEKEHLDLIKMGDELLNFKIENDNNPNFFCVHAVVDGLLEIIKEPSESVAEPNFMEEEETLFKIHSYTSERYLSRHFKFTPIIQIDNFSETTEIKWKRLFYGGKESTINFAKPFRDCIVLGTNNKAKAYDGLIFTFNHIVSKDYIVFKYFSSEYKLQVGSTISLLFENKEILDFRITTKPILYSKDDDWGHVFETKVQLTHQEIETLKKHKISDWRILISHDGQKIQGMALKKIAVALKRLARDYQDLVNENVPDYEPLTDKKQKSDAQIKANEACYVYLMVDLANNYHKIGISNKPEYREGTLQSEKPTIEMIANKRFPNRKLASSFEQALHQTYADKRIRGEWFELKSNEIDDLKQVLSD